MKLLIITNNYHVKEIQSSCLYSYLILTIRYLKPTKKLFTLIQIQIEQIVLSKYSDRFKVRVVWLINR